MLKQYIKFHFIARQRALYAFHCIVKELLWPMFRVDISLVMCPVFYGFGPERKSKNEMKIAS